MNFSFSRGSISNEKSSCIYFIEQIIEMNYTKSNNYLFQLTINLSQTVLPNLQFEENLFQDEIIVIQKVRFNFYFHSKEIVLLLFLEIQFIQKNNLLCFVNISVLKFSIGMHLVSSLVSISNWMNISSKMRRSMLEMMKNPFRNKFSRRSSLTSIENEKIAYQFYDKCFSFLFFWDALLDL